MNYKNSMKEKKMDWMDDQLKRWNVVFDRQHKIPMAWATKWDSKETKLSYGYENNIDA